MTCMMAPDLYSKKSRGETTMRKARKIVSIIVTLCFLLTLVPAGAFAAPKDTETPFDDVQTTDWFYDTVQYVYDEGLMAGTGDRIFSPRQTTTRGMIVTILHRMAGSPEAETQDFTDVDLVYRKRCWRRLRRRTFRSR